MKEVCAFDAVFRSSRLNVASVLPFRFGPESREESVPFELSAFVLPELSEGPFPFCDPSVACAELADESGEADGADFWESPELALRLDCARTGVEAAKSDTVTQIMDRCQTIHINAKLHPDFVNIADFPSGNNR
jgi:hypothetical protein